MTENSKLNLVSSFDSCGLGQKTDTPTQNSVSNRMNDGFVIDMESCSTPNSRVTRSLSRKGSQRIDKKINSNNTTANDRDSSISCSSSLKGPSTPEKPGGVVAGTTGEVHHQITITAGSITTATATESKFPFRRNSFKRCGSSPWLDPKRVLLIFASLSSMGTILLIYFTLSINKMNGDENALD